MEPLEFPKHPTIDQTYTDRRRIWTSRCGRYRLVENRSLFGLPAVWHAQVRVRENWGWCWDLLGRHRTRAAAEKTILKHARRQAREAKACRRAAAEKAARKSKNRRNLG